ncbi:MAG: hypothetical protein C0467_20225 [Planctomycetaceae bacterium]|nr:hypothetical protein [Planctomycetaceae bacterium]
MMPIGLRVRSLMAGSSLCLVMLVFCSAHAASPAERPKSDTAQFKGKVLPILLQSCVKCHNAEKPKGGFRIDTLNPDLMNGPDGEKWEEVLNQVNIGAMPPKGEKPLAQTDREALTGWLHKEMEVAAEFRANTGGRGVIRRLTRYEYNYTLQDLLELPINHAKSLPDDRAGSNGLKNNSNLLGMSANQFELYLETASTALRKAMVAPEKPQVVRHHLEAGEKLTGNGNQKLPGFGGYTRGVSVPGGVRLGENSYQPFPFSTFPREGRFRIRVRVGADAGEDEEHPRLQLWLGYRTTGTVLAREMVAELPVKAPLNKPEVLEFQGYLEDYPVPNTAPGKTNQQLMAFLIHPDDADEPPLAGKKAKEQAGHPVIQVNWLEFEAPYFETWPPASRVATIGSEGKATVPATRAREALTSFASRAWRRPVKIDEIEPLSKAFDCFFKQSGNFDAALRDAEAMILASPKFHYLVEPSKEQARRDLNAHELATRLSYFLWCSLPDAELRKLADSGELLKESVLAAQVRRVLEDPKARRFAKHFTEQWLGVDQMDSVAINPERYPNFKDTTKAAMRQEPIEFFWHVLSKDKSSLEFLSADYALVNESLADHYGLKGVVGSEFRAVPVRPESHRGGLLTMGCFMLAHSNGADSHPIFRGKWLLKDLFNEPPPPPPPGVPELNQADPNFAKLPLKKQLEFHRENAACAGCHNKLDPWGLALENFDAIGQWRASGPAGKAVATPESSKKRMKKSPQTVAMAAVDAAVRLPDGTAINGVEDLKKYCIEKKKNEFAKALVRKLLAYSLGRSLEWTDHAEVDRLTRLFAESNYKLQNLITEIVLSKTFRTR